MNFKEFILESSSYEAPEDIQLMAVRYDGSSVRSS